jgi:uncharacterized membrane protein
MPEKETARVEAFSDGVFAFAMTLLVLEIKVPHPTPDATDAKWWLATGLLALWPSFVAFVLSFGTVFIMWVNHHNLFKHAFRTSNGLLYANGFLLLLVTFVPFTTAVLAAYLKKPGASAAAAFYCATFVLIGLSYNLLLRAVVSNRADDAIGSPTHEATIARIRHAYRIGLLVYLSATFVAVFSPLGGLAICLSLWIVWAVLNYKAQA